MSARTLRELRTAIVKRAFEPVYYLHGDDDFRKDAAIRELTAAALDPATRDFNYDQLRAGDATPERLASALHTPPMMAERRLVILRDLPALKKDARAVLEPYLTRPSRDTVLVLVAPAGAKADKQAQDLAASYAFGQLTDEDLPDWIVQHAREAHGTTITPGAVALLQSVVGHDVAFLAAELDKLASYTGGAEIGEEAVAAVAGVRRGETMGDFLDRIAERNVPAALALIEHVLTLPKSGAVPIIMALTVQTMALGWARHARDHGLPAQRLESEFFGLLKETSAFPMRPWGEAVKCWARNAAKWDAASVERGLAVLLAADRAAKDTRLSSEEQMLASIVCSLCAPSARAVA